MLKVIGSTIVLLTSAGFAHAQDYGDLPITQIAKNSRVKFNTQLVLKAGETEKEICHSNRFAFWSPSLDQRVICNLDAKYHSSKVYDHATALPTTAVVQDTMTGSNVDDGNDPEHRISLKLGDHQYLEYQFSCEGLLKQYPALLDEIPTKNLSGMCTTEIIPYVELLDLAQPTNRVGEDVQPCAEVSDINRNAGYGYLAEGYQSNNVGMSINNGFNLR
tara:strand:- start:2042 stop:2695 length:654 start_codon:yes stop_codon:yes gene_type:complete